MIVVDSNLVAYLLIPGPNSAVAEDVLLKDPEWIAPFLWRSEFRNILALYMRHHKMTVHDARQTMRHAESLMAEREYFIPSDLILDLTLTTTLSAYDAEFVILAEQLQIDLLTFDKEILKAVPKIAVPPKKFV